MCGILGVCRRRPAYNSYNTVLDKEYDEAVKNYFTKVLVQSKQRGTDSTGMFLVQDYNLLEYEKNKDIEIFLLKNSVDATKFINDTQYSSLINKVNGYTDFVVGHTRQATSGDPDDNVNNHPFICGRIVGVHNGVIQNWESAADDNNITLKSECDSEIIFALINHFMELTNDLVKSIQMMAAQLKGWMACAFVDTMNPKELILFKRDAPLFMRVIKASNIMVFASDDTFIKNAISPNTKDILKTFDSTTGILDNNSGVIIKAFGDYSWLEKSKTFSLSA